MRSRNIEDDQRMLMVTYRKTNDTEIARNRIIALAIIVALVFFVCIISSTIASCSTESEESKIAEELARSEHISKTVSLSEQSVSFIAVGDNLPEISIAQYADSLAGDIGDGDYDYRPLFDGVRDRVQNADLAYIKQETHIGGSEIGPAGYPSFNTTDQMADAVVDAGFDLVASATNHSYDWGAFGALDHSCEVWERQPVTFTGTARSQEEADKIATTECNGMTFALLDYTYGINGYEPGSIPSYSVNLIDEERIENDVNRAKEIADVVMVAMHWGTEMQTTPDADQERYAQLLADLGVDIVLGSHTHTIGPLQWLEGKDGHKTLVAYSLGNFMSNHSYPSLKSQIEGMLSCTFYREDPTSPVQITDVVWIPLVNHSGNDGFCVYPLSDYTDDLAALHYGLSGLDDPLADLYDLTYDVIGEEFAIEGRESNPASSQ